MVLEGAIFDLDGTVMDSMYVWRTYGSEYLRRRGVTPRPDVDEHTKVMGLERTARYYISEYGLKDSVRDIMDDINRMVEGYYFNTVVPKPGAEEYLRQLRESGVGIVMATATSRYQVEAALRRCGLLGCFSELFTCPELGTDKDSPEIYEAALASLGTRKERTAVFDDAYAALKTAKDAGFVTVGVYDMYQNRPQEDYDAVADVYIRSWGELAGRGGELDVPGRDRSPEAAE